MTTVTLKLKLKDLKDGRKPYLLFAGNNFYPCGGWDDFKGGFSSIANAKLWLQKNQPDANFGWAHIVYDWKIIMWASCSNGDCPVYGEDGMWQWRLEE